MEHGGAAGPRDACRSRIAVRTEDERCRATLPLQHRRWSYVDRGRYASSLRHRDHFPAEQVLVLKSESLSAEPAAALARVSEFLGVGPFPRTARREVFALPFGAPMTESARRDICDTLSADTHELERMLGWDLQGLAAGQDRISRRRHAGHPLLARGVQSPMRRISIFWSHLTCRGPGCVSRSDTSASGPSDAGSRRTIALEDDERTLADR